ncbi:MAG: thermonuclease family protein, partial [Patescibacteria group bacterium]
MKKKKQIKPLGVILGLITLISLGLNVYLAGRVNRSNNFPETFRVTKVFDGDSFSIPPDQTIRLAKLDAPEIELCFGQEAKLNLEKLILNQDVKIEKAGKDSFNRTIAFVYLDNQSVNETLIKNGWAKYASGGTEQENKEVTELLKTEGERDKEKQLGVWGPNCYQKTNTANPGCDIKGNLGKHEHGEKKTYHYPGCSEYDRTIVELDLGEQW